MWLVGSSITTSHGLLIRPSASSSFLDSPGLGTAELSTLSGSLPSLLWIVFLLQTDTGLTPWRLSPGGSRSVLIPGSSAYLTRFLYNAVILRFTIKVVPADVFEGEVVTCYASLDGSGIDHFLSGVPF